MLYLLLKLLAGAASIAFEIVPTSWVIAGVVLVVSLELLGVPVFDTVLGTAWTVLAESVTWLIAEIEAWLTDTFGWSL